MSDLKTNLQEILQEKQDKIIPGNIKKDVQIFDVIGTYEGSVKLFETQEEMQADKNANEGDLAVIYREEIQNMTADTQTQFITFPETVTLPTAFSRSVYCELRAVDSSSGYFDGHIRLSQSSFSFEGFGDEVIEVQYTSSDGINYTRITTITNPVDLGLVVGVYRSDEWNDNFGYFMQVGESTFEGLYQHSLVTELTNDYVTLSNGFDTKVVKPVNIPIKELPEDLYSFNVFVYINSFETGETVKGNQIYIPKDYTLIYNYRKRFTNIGRIISRLDIYTR